MRSRQDWCYEVRLLIVDDDALIRETYQSVLSASGYLVDAAGDLPMIERMLKLSVPDYLLLDLMMRPKSGWDILEYLKQNPKSQNIPIILFSGKVIYPHEIRRYGEQVVGYIKKPTRLPHIISEIARVSSSRNEISEIKKKAATAGFSDEELTEFTSLLLNIPALDKLYTTFKENFSDYAVIGKDSGQVPDTEMDVLLSWIDGKKMRCKEFLDKIGS
jgi:CheY-like chemotaxis protein